MQIIFVRKAYESRSLHIVILGAKLEGRELSWT